METPSRVHGKAGHGAQPGTRLRHVLSMRATCPKEGQDAAARRRAVDKARPRRLFFFWPYGTACSMINNIPASTTTMNSATKTSSAHAGQGSRSRVIDERNGKLVEVWTHGKHCLKSRCLGCQCRRLELCLRDLIRLRCRQRRRGGGSVTD